LPVLRARMTTLPQEVALLSARQERLEADRVRPKDEGAA
jgi:hypothetical protein